MYFTPTSAVVCIVLIVAAVAWQFIDGYMWMGRWNEEFKDAYWGPNHGKFVRFGIAVAAAAVFLGLVYMLGCSIQYSLFM